LNGVTHETSRAPTPKVQYSTFAARALPSKHDARPCFHLVPKFPAEIRYVIWEEVANTTRNIDVGCLLGEVVQYAEDEDSNVMDEHWQYQFTSTQRHLTPPSFSVHLAREG
jgi:hypothetical protein